MSLSPPDILSDEELNRRLWQAIHSLALLQVFIEQTDNLSVREVYTKLYRNCLTEEIKYLAPDTESACHIEMHRAMVRKISGIT